jgi:hypothetical protein
MPLRIVRKEEIHVVEVEVQAKDDDEARDKVHRGLGREIGACEFDRIHSATVEDWEVYPVTVTGKRKRR